MQQITTVPAMHHLSRRWRKLGARVGFVPTMGYLHAGHLSLIRRARREVGKTGKVVVSIYVNPTQFGPGEDYSRYPRDLARDLRLCRAEGVDAVFVPSDQQMYPAGAEGASSTVVVEQKVSQFLEGASRPGHFRGVTTVLAKLFNLVQPQVAVFGAKDFQQAAVVRRMVRDLHFPIRIAVAPIVREPDGLAMSSRNRYLRGQLRAQATALWHGIREAQRAVRKSPRPIAAVRLKSDLRQLLERQPAARVDYVEFFDPETFEPVKTVTRGSHIALAVWVGKVRLIDNAPL